MLYILWMVDFWCISHLLGAQVLHGAPLSLWISPLRIYFPEIEIIRQTLIFMEMEL